MLDFYEALVEFEREDPGVFIPFSLHRHSLNTFIFCLSPKGSKADEAQKNTESNLQLFPFAAQGTMSRGSVRADAAFPDK